MGAVGFLIDMAMLHLLVRHCNWDINISKLCSAETAMLNNFALNEMWTFRGCGSASRLGCGWGWRLLRFQAICGVGIGVAVMLLSVFYRGFNFNLYMANCLTIMLVTLWNFSMNVLFNWSDEANGKDGPV